MELLARLAIVTKPSNTKKNRNVNSRTSIDRSKGCFRCILELCADYNHMVMMAQKVKQVNSYFKLSCICIYRICIVFDSKVVTCTCVDSFICIFASLLYLYLYFVKKVEREEPLQARLTLGLIAGAPALPLIYLSTPHTDDIRYISFIVYLYFAPTDLFIP